MYNKSSQASKLSALVSDSSPSGAVGSEPPVRVDTHTHERHRWQKRQANRVAVEVNCSIRISLPLSCRSPVQTKKGSHTLYQQTPFVVEQDGRRTISRLQIKWRTPSAIICCNALFFSGRTYICVGIFKDVLIGTGAKEQRLLPALLLLSGQKYIKKIRNLKRVRVPVPVCSHPPARSDRYLSLEQAHRTSGVARGWGPMGATRGLLPGSHLHSSL